MGRTVQPTSSGESATAGSGPVATAGPAQAGAPLPAADRTRQLEGRARASARQGHAAVLVFFLVDASLLTGYGLTGAIPRGLGVGFGIVGCGVGWALSTMYWRRGGQADEIDRLTLLQAALAIGLMLATLVLAPAVGGLVLMSMMAVLSLTAISLRGRALLGLWLATCAVIVLLLVLSDRPIGFPVAGVAERVLTGFWLVLLMLKSTAQNMAGRQLRQLVDDSNTRLERALLEVAKIAATDELTTLPNRRSIVAGFQQALDGDPRRSACPAVALLDIDHFKGINDRHGHEVGDRVLQRFAEVVSTGLRPGDTVGRYGGEEFLLLLEGPSGGRAALEVAGRLRERIAAHDWSRVAPGLAVTVSIGVAMVQPGDDTGAAIRRADAALYDAKRQGRNRVVLEGETLEGPEIDLPRRTSPAAFQPG